MGRMGNFLNNMSYGTEYYFEEDCDPFYKECAPLPIDPADGEDAAALEEEIPENEKYMKFYPFAPVCSLVAGFMNYNTWQTFDGDGDWSWKFTYLLELSSGLTSLILWFLTDEFPQYSMLDNVANAPIELFAIYTVSRSNGKAAATGSSTIFSYMLHSWASIVAVASGISHYKYYRRQYPTTYAEPKKTGDGTTAAELGCDPELEVWCKASDEEDDGLVTSLLMLL